MSAYRTMLGTVALAGAITLVPGVLHMGIVSTIDAGDDLAPAGAASLQGASVTRQPCSDRTMGRPDEVTTRSAAINVIVRASGSSSITVAPGAEVHYEVVAELTDSENEGLALFMFDLQFDGGDLPQADTPVDPPMNGFVIPNGFTNSAGFGGSVGVPGREGDLVQVGGAQNVIKNTVDIAPYPIGSVIPGVAWPGSPQVLATGTLTAPTIDGIYTLQLTNLAARVIKQGEAGFSSWATVSVGPGAITDLTIVVSPAEDCNGNGIPDGCDVGCGLPDGPCDVPGCGESADDNGNGIPDECEDMARLTLNAGAACYGLVEPDSTVTVTMDLSAATDTVVGGDFFLKYDPTVLDFVSAVPGDPPFILQLSEFVDEDAGRIDYAVAVGFGGTGTAADSTMAVITFTAVGEVCDATGLVWFDRSHAPPTRLSGEAGQQIDPMLTDLSTVTVDGDDPTITCPTEVSVSTDPGVCYATDADLGAPATNDNCGIAGVTNDAPVQFPVGTTVVTWTATDDCGNAAACTQNVMVTEDEPPTITCPVDLSLSADPGVCQASNVDLGAPTTGDNCGVESVSNDAPMQFPVGTVVVTWLVTDTAGNTAACAQNVTVAENEPPTIACPADVSVSTDPGVCHTSNVDLGAPTTDDNCGVDDVSNDAPLQFPVGTTAITWTVRDTAGNAAECTQHVTVTDDEPPTITRCPSDLPVHAHAGGCDAAVTWTGPTAEDNCGLETLTSTHNPGDTFPAGTTVVTCTATDIHGGTSTCAFDVTVEALNELVATIELSPTVQTPLTRCITVELWECTSSEPIGIVSTEFTFTDAGDGVARATQTLLIPCGFYDCITARDELHTLRRTMNRTPGGDFDDVAHQYVADFAAANKPLVGGNLNDSFYIDILDYGEFLGQWNTPSIGDTPCGTAYPHADINGDGMVGTADFTFIQANYWQSHEDNCCSQPGSRGGDGDPIGRISVKELRRRGLGRLSVADLDGDGWLDERDLAAFIQGVRPKPADKLKRTRRNRPGSLGTRQR